MESGIKKFIGISLIYDSSMWHKLVIDAILPFLGKEGINDFSIKLSRHMGDHIKLVLGTDSDGGRPLAARADKFFAEFFNDYPSQRNGIGKKVGLFADFENNSVHYGAFDYVEKQDVYSPEWILSQGASSVVTKVFKFYKEETIKDFFEIMLELLVISSNVAGLNNSEAANLFNSLLEKDYKKYGKELLTEVKKNCKENFQRNKAVILEYLCSWEKGDSELWKLAWKDTVTKYLNLVSGFQPKDKSNILFPAIEILIDTFGFQNTTDVYCILAKGYIYSKN